MKTDVSIASPLRKYTEKNSCITLDAATVRELLEKLTAQYPDLIQTICEEDLSIKPIVSIYVGERNCNDEDGLETRLDEGVTVYIVPTIAGG